MPVNNPRATRAAGGRMPVERSTKPGGPPLAAILGAVGAASVAAAAATIVAIRHKASAVPPGTRAKTSGKEDEQPRTSAVTAGGKDIIVPVPSEPGSAPHTSSNQQELSPIEQGGLKETAFPSDAETVTETAKVSQEEHHASEDPPVMQTSEADTSQDDATGMVKSKEASKDVEAIAALLQPDSHKRQLSSSALTVSGDEPNRKSSKHGDEEPLILLGVQGGEVATAGGEQATKPEEKTKTSAEETAATAKLEKAGPIQAAEKAEENLSKGTAITAKGIELVATGRLQGKAGGIELEEKCSKPEEMVINVMAEGKAEAAKAEEEIMAVKAENAAPAATEKLSTEKVEVYTTKDEKVALEVEEKATEAEEDVGAKSKEAVELTKPDEETTVRADEKADLENANDEGPQLVEESVPQENEQNLDKASELVHATAPVIQAGADAEQEQGITPVAPAPEEKEATEAEANMAEPKAQVAQDTQEGEKIEEAGDQDAREAAPKIPEPKQVEVATTSVAGGSQADSLEKCGNQDTSADAPVPTKDSTGSEAKSSSPLKTPTKALPAKTGPARASAVTPGKKVKPNEPCPCGRYHPARKYKKCCGKGGP